MSNAYILDTSAIFAFTDNEPGADLVEELLEKVCISLNPASDFA